VELEPDRSLFNGWLFSAITRSASAVTACSTFLASEAASRVPGLSQKCVVIRNGVDVGLFRNAVPHHRDRRYFLCVGQVETHKGFDLAIAALAGIQDRLASVDLLIVGKGSQETALARQADSLGVSSRVEFLGKLEHGPIASIMRGSAAVLVPSRRESLGLVALEARVAGCCIAATKIGGVAEALAGYQVEWIVPESVEDLQRAMVALASLSTPAAGVNVQLHDKEIDSFSWYRCTREYLSVFGGLL